MPARDCKGSHKKTFDPKCLQDIHLALAGAAPKGVLSSSIRHFFFKHFGVDSTPVLMVCYNLHTRIEACATVTALAFTLRRGAKHATLTTNIFRLVRDNGRTMLDVIESLTVNTIRRESHNHVGKRIKKLLNNGKDSRILIRSRRNPMRAVRRSLHNLRDLNRKHSIIHIPRIEPAEQLRLADMLYHSIDPIGRLPIVQIVLTDSLDSAESITTLESIARAASVHGLPALATGTRAGLPRGEGPGLARHFGGSGELGSGVHHVPIISAPARHVKGVEKKTFDPKWLRHIGLGCAGAPKMGFRKQKARKGGGTPPRGCPAES